MNIILYPRWLYHATLPACIVETHEERETLGDEWVEHPSLLPTAPAPVAAEAAAVEPRKKRK